MSVGFSVNKKTLNLTSREIAGRINRGTVCARTFGRTYRKYDKNMKHIKISNKKVKHLFDPQTSHMSTSPETNKVNSFLYFLPDMVQSCVCASAQIAL